ncbi:hypothetical protein HDU93_001905, partial [Gonapodya sp. JEL0774]
MREFSSDLAEFLDEKVAEIEAMEEELAGIERERLEVKESVWAKTMDTAFSNITTAGIVRPTPSSAPLGELLSLLDTPLPVEISQDLNRRFTSLQTRHRHIFADSLAEFSDLDSVLGRFSAWGQKYPEDFARGYGAESLHGVVDLWARWETMRMEMDGIDPNLESTSWHAHLSNLHLPALPPSSSNVTDDQPSLVALVKVVEKSIVPIVRGKIQRWAAWDPKEGKDIVAWIMAVREYVSVTSEAYKSVSTALLSRLSQLTMDLMERCDFAKFPIKADSAAGVVQARSRSYDALYGSITAWSQLLSAALHVRKFLPPHGARELILNNTVEKLMLPSLARSATYADELLRMEK